ncbi:MAG: phospholipase [bacterium]|nr:phospholipase [bacterium]
MTDISKSRISGDRIDYLDGADLYYEIIEGALMNAEDEVVIATANLKDVRVRFKNRFVSIVKIFNELVQKGVIIRLLHASDPSKAYFKSLRKTVLEKQSTYERLQCPRVHLKTVIIDRKLMYIGSANLTGAGLGFKSEEKRNFEIGLKVTESGLISEVYRYFDLIWNGELCIECGRRDICPKPIK